MKPGLVLRATGATSLSALVHAIAIVLVLLGLHYAPAAPRTEPVVREEPRQIIWLTAAGPGGGGGGGGNRMKAPARRAQLPGHDEVTVPVGKPTPVLEPSQVTRTEPPTPTIPQLDIAALALAHGTQALPGTLDGVPGGVSQGLGSGGGAGTGRGGGIGAGTGDGLGDGYGRGSGGDVYRPGAGIQDPIPIYQPKPAYTPEAMQARIQGVAVVECVVMADGSVSNPRLVRSLDARFGLDSQAVSTARKWRFIPARRHGQPVAMLIVIELTFSLV